MCNSLVIAYETCLQVVYEHIYSLTISWSKLEKNWLNRLWVRICQIIN